MNAVLSLLLEYTLSHKQVHPLGNNLPTMGHAPSHGIWAARLPAYVSDASMTAVDAAWAELAALEKPCLINQDNNFDRHRDCLTCDGTGRVPLLPMLRQIKHEMACPEYGRAVKQRHTSNEVCKGYTAKRDAWELLKAVDAMRWHADYREQEWTVWRGTDMKTRTASDTDEPWSGLVLAIYAMVQQQETRA